MCVHIYKITTLYLYSKEKLVNFLYLYFDSIICMYKRKELMFARAQLVDGSQTTKNFLK